MNAVEPPLFAGSHHEILASDQAQYTALPVSIDADGVVLTEWELSAVELEKILCGGRIRLWVHTFGQGFHPVSLEVIEPDCGMRES